MVDEIKLIDRIKHGDRRALDTLIKAYYQNIFAYFYYHTQNREISMDLTQEVFVKMVASIELMRIVVSSVRGSLPLPRTI